MLRPSYNELMRILNEDPSLDDKITSRYAIVIAAAKRARQIIGGAMPQAECSSDKALSVALNEMENRFIKIIPSEDARHYHVDSVYRRSEYRPIGMEPDSAEEIEGDYEDPQAYEAAYSSGGYSGPSDEVFGAKNPELEEIFGNGKGFGESYDDDIDDDPMEDELMDPPPDEELDEEELEEELEAPEDRLDEEPDEAEDEAP